MEYLANWYFGNKCVHCGRIDSGAEEYGRKCWEHLHKLKEAVCVTEMTHKEYIQLFKTTGNCKPTTREYPECSICETIGEPNNK